MRRVSERKMPHPAQKQAHRAPSGKVDVPVVQAQRDIANSVSEVPPDGAALCVVNELFSQ